MDTYCWLRRIATAFVLGGAAWIPLTALSAVRPAPSAGFAWKVQGEWTTKKMGLPIRAGDPVLPGSLVQPAGLDQAHSLTLLLPDGQQLLFECFTPEDCDRGFRVPSLVEQPSRFAVEMMSRIRKSVSLSEGKRAGAIALPSRPRRTMPALDEATVIWNDGGAVPVAGLLAALPSGRYTYVLQTGQRMAPQQDAQVLIKSSGACLVPLPRPGLYDMVVSDMQGVQRIDMFVAVLSAKDKLVQRSYSEAKELLDDWNEKFTGWPEHELLRAYLRSWLSDSK